MKIAMIGQKGMPAIYGGVETHVQELSVRLVKCGHDVTAYSRPWYTTKKIKSLKGVKIKYLPSIKTKHLDTITHTLLATIHAIVNRYDIIHYHGVGPALLAWMPRVFSPQAKVIVTFHSIDRKHTKWNWFARFMLKMGEWTTCRFPHKTIAVSRTIEQYARDVYDTQSTLIPNGVPKFQKNKNTNKLKKWDLKSGSYILIVSRLIPHKGVHYAIEAYHKLTKQNPKLMKNFPLVIVGDGYHTDKYVKELKEKAKTDKQIIFTGFQNGEALVQLYSNAKLMIHPSDAEGLPITVLEGMSYGLPVLVSDIIEHRELVGEREYTFIRGNSGSLAKRLTSLLRKDQTELKLQGLGNARYVHQAYGWDAIVENTIDLYQSETKQTTREALQLA